MPSSSLSSLPNELAAEVFVQCLGFPLWVQNEGTVIPERDDAPLSLTKVCRDWRALALGTTALWCRICINLLNRAGEIHPLLFVWLQRAGARPIHLALDLVKPRELEQLLHRFPTITSLRITSIPVEEHPPTAWALHSAPVDLGSVQNLVFDGGVLGLDCDGWDSVLDQLSAPHLRTLKFRSHTPLPQVLSLLQRSECGHLLTRLSLATAGASPILLDILRATPALRILRLDDSDAVPRRQTSTPALLHLHHADVVPHLADLHVHASLREEHFPDFLAILQERRAVLRHVHLNLLHWPRSSRDTAYHFGVYEEHNGSFPGPSIRAALQVLVEAGLDLSLVIQE